MSDLLNDLEAVVSFDKSVFGQLCEDMGEDVQEVLEAFLEAIEELLVELKDRSVDESSDAISRWAHSIKSSAASIGMMRLSAIAAHLERMQKQGEVVNVDDLIRQIENEYQHSRTLLDR